MIPAIIAVAAVAVVVLLYFVFGKKSDPAKLEAEEPEERPKALKPAEKAEAKADKPKEVAPAAKEAAKPAPKKPAPEAAKPAAKKPPPPSEEEEEEDGEDEGEEERSTKESVTRKLSPKDVGAPAPAAAKSEEDEPRREPVKSESARPAAKAETRPVAAAKRAKDVGGLRKGLAKTRGNEGFFGKLRSLFSGKKEIDPNIVEQIEEVLLTSDVGVKTTELLVGSIKESLAKNELRDESRVWEALRTKASEILEIGGGALVVSEKPTVVMVVGVNGVGKTTTIGKLATRLTQQGKRVVLAAGDTFRAAAVQQLTVWGKRVGCEVVSGAEGANPGAVIFDAIQRAKELKADVVLADTAGRLHTKTNLMEELKKIQRTMSKAMDGAPHETLLVVDATTGQNAIQQAALFKEALPLTGIVLTKLDGTAKGGVVLSICAEHEVPVRYIGIGERAEDLRDFNGEEFVEALLGREDERDDAAA